MLTLHCIYVHMRCKYDKHKMYFSGIMYVGDDSSKLLVNETNLNHNLLYTIEVHTLEYITFVQIFYCNV